MKSFGLVSIVVMIGIAASAAGLSAPIDGYEVVNITWSVPSKAPGATPLNLTGTVQEVWRHINTRTGLTGRQNTGGSAPLPPRHNLTDGYLICGNQLDANRQAIRDGVAYLRDVPGKPGMPPGPRVCGRVSCSDNSAIWWCNDNDHSFFLNSFSDIADAASDIELQCSFLPPKYAVWTSGQIFYEDHWNVLVRYDDDHC